MCVALKSHWECVADTFSLSSQSQTTLSSKKTRASSSSTYIGLMMIIQIKTFLINTFTNNVSTKILIGT